MNERVEKVTDASPEFLLLKDKSNKLKEEVQFWKAKFSDVEDEKAEVMEKYVEESEANVQLRKALQENKDKNANLTQDLTENQAQIEQKRKEDEDKMAKLEEANLTLKQEMEAQKIQSVQDLEGLNVKLAEKNLKITTMESQITSLNKEAQEASLLNKANLLTQGLKLHKVVSLMETQAKAFNVSLQAKEESADFCSTLNYLERNFEKFYEQTWLNWQGISAEMSRLLKLDSAGGNPFEDLKKCLGIIENYQLSQVEGIVSKLLLELGTSTAEGSEKLTLYRKVSEICRLVSKQNENIKEMDNRLSKQNDNAKVIQVLEQSHKTEMAQMQDKLKAYEGFNCANCTEFKDKEAKWEQEKQDLNRQKTEFEITKRTILGLMQKPTLEHRDTQTEQDRVASKETQTDQDLTPLPQRSHPQSSRGARGAPSGRGRNSVTASPSIRPQAPPVPMTASPSIRPQAPPVSMTASPSLRPQVPLTASHSTGPHALPGLIHHRPQQPHVQQGHQLPMQVSVPEMRRSAPRPQVTLTVAPNPGMVYSIPANSVAPPLVQRPNTSTNVNVAASIQHHPMPRQQLQQFPQLIIPATSSHVQQGLPISQAQAVPMRAQQDPLTKQQQLFFYHRKLQTNFSQEERNFVMNQKQIWLEELAKYSDDPYGVSDDNESFKELFECFINSLLLVRQEEGLLPNCPDDRFKELSRITFNLVWLDKFGRSPDLNLVLHQS